MRHNKIKIISNQNMGLLAYRFMNENEEWVHIDSASQLSRNEYKYASLSNKSEEIIEIIDDVYNVGNRGVDIVLECSTEEYRYFNSILQARGDLSIQAKGIDLDENRRNEDVHTRVEKKTNNVDNSKLLKNTTEKKRSSKKKKKQKEVSKGGFDKINEKKVVGNIENRLDSNAKEENIYDDIFCEKKNICIVVAGKVNSGKSTLIEALGDLDSEKLKINKQSNYTVYIDDSKELIWYEINGIDFGKEYVQKAKQEIESIANENMTVFIYCFSTNKIEDIEIRLILELKNKYPNTRYLCALTSCIDDDAYEIADKMSQYLAGIKVMPVLAKDKKMKQGIIPAYGLEEIIKNIYGGR